MLQGPEGGGLTVAVMLVVPVYAVNIDGVLGDGRTEDLLGTEEGQGEGGGDTQTEQEDNELHGQSVSTVLPVMQALRVSHSIQTDKEAIPRLQEYEEIENGLKSQTAF